MRNVAQVRNMAAEILSGLLQGNVEWVNDKVETIPEDYILLDDEMNFQQAVNEGLNIFVKSDTGMTRTSIRKATFSSNMYYTFITTLERRIARTAVIWAERIYDMAEESEKKQHQIMLDARPKYIHICEKCHEEFTSYSPHLHESPWCPSCDIPY